MQVMAGNERGVKIKRKDKEGKMPIFEYRCRECGHRFDAFFRRAEDAEKESPECGKCGSGHVRKLFSTIGLSGTGGAESGFLSGECGARST